MSIDTVDAGLGLNALYPPWLDAMHDATVGGGLGIVAPIFTWSFQC